MKMKRAVTAVAAVAVIVLGAACDSGKGDGGFAPKACILVGRDEVRNATDNRQLERQGQKDTDFGGTVCTYKDSKRPVYWRFAAEPVTREVTLAAFRERLEKSGYQLRVPTAAQAPTVHTDKTFVLYKDGDFKTVRGIMTTYQDTTITVYAPLGGNLKRAVDLRDLVWDGFTDQAAAAVAGQ